MFRDATVDILWGFTFILKTYPPVPRLLGLFRGILRSDSLGRGPEGDCLFVASEEGPEPTV